MIQDLTYTLNVLQKVKSTNVQKNTKIQKSTKVRKVQVYKLMFIRLLHILAFAMVL